MAERRSPIYEIHARSAVRMVKGGGDYLFPLAYTSPAEEHLNVRTNVGMQDLTSMGEVDLKGPGAERLLSRLAVANLYDLQPGQVRYTTFCQPDGRIVDDVTVYKFGDEHFMVVTSSAPRKKTFRWIAEHAAGTGAYVNDVSGAIALISVQGPRSRDFLASTVAEPAALLALKFFRFAPNQIGDTELLVSRSGYTGELGYELYVPAEEAALLWETLERRGKEFGLLPYGTAAMQSLGAAVDSDDEDELGSDGGSDWEEEEEWEEEMTADDEAALAAFMAPGAADYKQRTLSDLIMEKIKLNWFITASFIWAAPLPISFFFSFQMVR